MNKSFHILDGLFQRFKVKNSTKLFHYDDKVAGKGKEKIKFSGNCFVRHENSTKFGKFNITCFRREASKAE